MKNTRKGKKTKEKKKKTIKKKECREAFGEEEKYTQAFKDRPSGISFFKCQ